MSKIKSKLSRIIKDYVYKSDYSNFMKSVDSRINTLLYNVKCSIYVLAESMQ